MAPLAPPKFIQTYLPLAQQWEAKTGIPASTYLAIIASESNWGNADNALFGIKGSGDAGSLDSATWESEGGQRVNTRAGFANYSSANAAFQGFWDLMNTPYYASALKELQVNHDPDAFLHRINQLNYATDPNWADKIQSSAQTTMEPLIRQAGGGATMGQQQDGDPNQAIIDAAINGDLPGASTADPGTTGSNAPPASTDPNQPAMNGNDILQLVVDKIGPYASRSVLNPTTKTTGGAFGPTEGPTHAPTYRYTWANGKTLDIAALDSGAVVKGGTALAVLSSGTAPITRTFPDGSLRQYDPDSKQWTTIAAAPETKAPKTVNTKAGTFAYDGASWTMIPGTGPASVQIHTMPDGSLQQYDPDSGQWTMIQPRYVDPTETQYKTALTAEANANTAKIQMGLRPTALAAIEDAGKTIDAIEQQWKSGGMGTGAEAAQKANALMEEVRQGLAATLAGTTIFEQNKQAQDTQIQRAQTASSLLNQRVASASSLGSSLFSAATANGGILQPKGGGSWGIDPLQIANQEVNQMGGGQTTGDAAAAFLRAALGGGEPPAAGAVPASPTGPGRPPAGTGAQFPTTREAVLAQYPHLATPQENAQAMAPVGAPQQGQPLTVPPPRPISPTNQLLQAGG